MNEITDEDEREAIRKAQYRLDAAEQIQSRTKRVTRRLGWKMLKPGDQICAVKKAMGLRKGEKVERLAVLTVLSVTHEPLRRMTDDLAYGFAETTREGFPEGHDWHWPSQFVEMFCASHRPCTPDSMVTRIEFDYDDTEP